MIKSYGTYLHKQPSGRLGLICESAEQSPDLPQDLQGPGDEEGDGRGPQHRGRRCQRADLDVGAREEIRMRCGLFRFHVSPMHTRYVTVWAGRSKVGLDPRTMIADQVDPAAVARNAQGMVLHARAPAYVAEDQDLDGDGLLGRRRVLDVARGEPQRHHQNPGEQAAQGRAEDYGENRHPFRAPLSPSPLSRRCLST